MSERDDNSEARTVDSRRQPRVLFVDVVRLIAAFQMMNGHTIGAIMPLSIQQGLRFEFYTDLRGLVSVAFLFVAGIAFHLSTLVRLEQHRSTPGAVTRRLRRALSVIAFGYLLHPVSAVGVLHAIGFTFVVLELMTFFVRDPRYVVRLCAVLAIAVFLTASWVDRSGFAASMPWVGQWFTHRGGSFFPLFPWSAYVLSGVVVGSYILPHGGFTNPDLSLRRTVLVLVFAWCVSSFATLALADVDLSRETFDTRLPIALNKLVEVSALLLFAAATCRGLKTLPSLLRILATESLTVYVCHLMILYFPGLALIERVGRTETLWEALLWVIPVMVLTCSYTYLWHTVKKKWRRRGTVRVPLLGSRS